MLILLSHWNKDDTFNQTLQIFLIAMFYINDQNIWNEYKLVYGRIHIYRFRCTFDEELGIPPWVELCARIQHDDLFQNYINLENIDIGLYRSWSKILPNRKEKLPRRLENAPYDPGKQYIRPRGRDFPEGDNDDKNIVAYSPSNPPYDPSYPSYNPKRPKDPSYPSYNPNHPDDPGYPSYNPKDTHTIRLHGEDFPEGDYDDKSNSAYTPLEHHAQSNTQSGLYTPTYPWYPKHNEDNQSSQESIDTVNNAAEILDLLQKS